MVMCVDCKKEVTTYILDKNNEPHCLECTAVHLSKIAGLIKGLAERRAAYISEERRG